MAIVVRLFRVVAAGIALAFGCGAPAKAAEPVDLELVLAVDVSFSIAPHERELQRRGYAAALTHDQVLAAIRGGFHGRIAVIYIEWAGARRQEIIVPWTLIEDRADAERVVARLLAAPSISAKRTSIANAIDFSAGLFGRSGFDGTRHVIDVSGDGPNNEGRTVEASRDAAVARGITINGLPLMISPRKSPLFPVEIDRYFEECAIGGPSSFIVPVTRWDQFPDAVRRKLVLEIAGVVAPVPASSTRITEARPAIAKTRVKADCFVGESEARFWDRYRIPPPAQ